jgi:hypothetical protein
MNKERQDQDREERHRQEDRDERKRTEDSKERHRREDREELKRIEEREERHRREDREEQEKRDEREERHRQEDKEERKQVENRLLGKRKIHNNIHNNIDNNINYIFDDWLNHITVNDDILHHIFESNLYDGIKLCILDTMKHFTLAMYSSNSKLYVINNDRKGIIWSEKLSKCLASSITEKYSACFCQSVYQSTLTADEKSKCLNILQQHNDKQLIILLKHWFENEFKKYAVNEGL